jgi:hypothetical protein
MPEMPKEHAALTSLLLGLEGVHMTDSLCKKRRLSRLRYRWSWRRSTFRIVQLNQETEECTP